MFADFKLIFAKKCEKFWRNFLKYWGLRGAKACKYCRSRQELSNEYLLAKFGVDTEENEPQKSLLIWLKNQGMVRYRTFQLRSAGAGPCPGRSSGTRASRRFARTSARRLRSATMRSRSTRTLSRSTLLRDNLWIRVIIRLVIHKSYWLLLNSFRFLSCRAFLRLVAWPKRAPRRLRRAFKRARRRPPWAVDKG